MRIVVSSKKEREILIQLLDFLNKKDLELFLYFKDPLSFKIEEVFEELCNCYVEVDKTEEPIFLNNID